VHIDISTDSPDEMDRLRRLDARPLREIRGSDGRLWWTIMADIEGTSSALSAPLTSGRYTQPWRRK